MSENNHPVPAAPPGLRIRRTEASADRLSSLLSDLANSTVYVSGDTSGAASVEDEDEHPSSLETIWSHQCHSCLAVDLSRPQALACGCGNRFYCSDACCAADYATHRSLCSTPIATSGRPLTSAERQNVPMLHRKAIASYDRLNFDHKIEVAMDSLLEAWFQECQESDGAMTFPSYPIPLSAWKEHLRKTSYFHLLLSVSPCADHDNMTRCSFVKAMVRPLPELNPMDLERTYALCKAFHPAIVVGHTVVAEGTQVAFAMPYVVPFVHRVPEDVIRQAYQKVVNRIPRLERVLG